MDSQTIGNESPSSFDIRRVGIQELPDVNSFIVALSEDSLGSGRCLLIQTALAFDEQDRKNGMDTYSVSNEAGATVYGGLLGYALTGNRLTLRFNQAAAAMLGTGVELHLVLRVDQQALAKLKGGLGRILALDDA